MKINNGIKMKKKKKKKKTKKSKKKKKTKKKKKQKKKKNKKKKKKKTLKIEKNCRKKGSIRGLSQKYVDICDKTRMCMQNCMKFI